MWGIFQFEFLNQVLFISAQCSLLLRLDAWSEHTNFERWCTGPGLCCWRLSIQNCISQMNFSRPVLDCRIGIITCRWVTHPEPWENNISFIFTTWWTLSSYIHSQALDYQLLTYDSSSPLTLDGPDIVLNVETQLANISIPRTDLRHATCKEAPIIS